MILDTQFLGQLAAQDRAARALAEEIESSGSPRRIPAAVVAELFYGLGKMADDEQAAQIRRTYEMLFRSATVLPQDEKVARRSGTLRGKHAGSDDLRNLDGADSVVAAHGLLLDEAVVSNDADFQDVDGLAVRTY